MKNIKQRMAMNFIECSDCISRQNLVLFLQQTRVVPLVLSLPDMAGVPVFRSTASVEDMRVGTEGPRQSPTGKGVESKD